MGKSYATAHVTLVAVDRENGNIMQATPGIEDVLLVLPLSLVNNLAIAPRI